jgi:hypothetical protein
MKGCLFATNIMDNGPRELSYERYIFRRSAFFCRSFLASLYFSFFSASLLDLSSSLWTETISTPELRTGQREGFQIDIVQGNIRDWFWELALSNAEAKHVTNIGNLQTKEGVVHDAIGVTFVCELPIHRRQRVPDCSIWNIKTAI